MPKKKDEIRTKTSNVERYADSIKTIKSIEMEPEQKASHKAVEVKSNVEMLLEEIRDLLIDIKEGFYEEVE